MSETATPIRECDSALDYLYGMLSGEEKTRFEAHLASCARCQTELEGFGRVREVARAALPSVEPTERLTGGLHQQLLHAAAQRKPRGKVLPFMRRVLSHPGYAAAAGLLIVGGAIGVQWTRGRLVMPAPEAAAPISAPAAPPAQPVLPGAAAPEPAVPEAEAAKQVAELDTKAAAHAGPQPNVQAVAPAKPLPRKEPAQLDDGIASSFATGSAEKKKATSFGKDDRTEGGLLGAGSKGGEAQESLGARGVGGNGSGAGFGRASTPAGKPLAPPASRQAMAPAEADVAAPEPSPPPAPAPSKKRSATTQAYANAEPKLSEPAMEERRAPADEKPAREKNAVTGDRPGAALDKTYKAESQAPLESEKKEQRLDSVDVERNRAASFAQSGRCLDAAAIYETIEKRSPTRLTAQDRLGYARCLRTLGRLDSAQRELDQLQANRAQAASLPKAALNLEQSELDLSRKRQAGADARSTGESQAATRSKAKKAVKTVQPPDSLDVPAARDANVKKAF